MSTAPSMFNFLIRAMREQDKQIGNNFLKTLYAGLQVQWQGLNDAIELLEDMYDPYLCPDSAIDAVMWNVGITKDLDNITASLSSENKRKLFQFAVALWKMKGTEEAIALAIYALTGRPPWILNWHRARFVLDMAGLWEIWEGADCWVQGGISSDLDEFWSNVRVMDDGTLDHDLVENVIGLLRPSNERYLVSYVDFLDRFQLGRDLWLSIAGTPSTTADREFLIPADSAERIDLPQAAAWTDYVSTTKVMAKDASDWFEIRFYWQDALNYYFCALDYANHQVITGSVVAGVRVNLVTTATPWLVANYWYSVRVDVQPTVGGTRIRTFLDGDDMANVIDANFALGNIVLATDDPGGGPNVGNIHVDNLELFQRPLATGTVEP